MSQKVIAICITALLVFFWLVPAFRSRATAKSSSGGVARKPSSSSDTPRLPAPDEAFTDASVHATGKDKRLVAGPALSWSKRAAANDEVVKIIPTAKYQQIVGFGGAFTDAACYMFNQMSGEARAKLFHELFAPTEMGLNVNRTCMGSSDYATHMYSYDEGEPDPELKRFSIDHDRKYILPMLREARAINPDIFLFSSPWSPPGWMKANGSMLGGNMRREYMPSYANYFVKFLKGYEAEGVPVQAITVQNEVDTDQDGRMPACAWPQEYEVDFVRHHLGPLFQKEGIASQIWIIDHNYNLWGRALGSLDTPDLRKYVSAIAWHGYVGDAYRMSTVHDAYPDVDMYWTEGGPDYTDPNYATDWTKWSRTFTGNLRHWCRAITVWNLALDEAGRPNIGPFPCGGLVTINSASREVTRSGQFWALAQYSRFIKRGAVRIGSEGGSADLAHVAFLNPDGQYVLVLTNSGRARTVAIELNGLCASLQLESDSVTTLTWKSAAAS